MLELILGRAGSGKTARAIEEIRVLASRGEGPAFLLVPEQYSHEAERELCSLVGDSLSLHAEVLSFTGLARRVEAEKGAEAGLLDRGGRLLCAALAVDAAASRLRVYASARRRPELQRLLLGVIDEFKAAGIGAQELLSAHGGADGLLGDKLSDLSLILGAYEAVVARGSLDPSDRLTRLKELIPGSSVCKGRFFIDGFIDFTAQEEEVIAALLRDGASVRVCLTCPSLDDENEVFAHSRGAALSLLRRAGELGVPGGVTVMEGSRKTSPALDFLDNHLFERGFAVFDGEARGISLHKAEGIEDECRLAAVTARRLVIEGGCRWRDIAVAVRGFEDYRLALQSVFNQYGVPLYAAEKSDVSSRPIPALISSALDAVSGGFRYEDMFACLKTGLMGLSADECDILENYVFLWSIRGSAWTRESPWTLHPGGYGAEVTRESDELLARLDVLRRRAAGPLRSLAERGSAASTASEQAAALCAFLEDIGLVTRLEARAGALRASGREALAAEYVQLWDIVVGALEQCAGILGDMPMTQEEFAPLIKLVLSEYSVGTIPVSLDRVSAGDMDRMRRRSIKHLIVLGASDDRLPAARRDKGIFSSEEREALAERGLRVGGWNEDNLERELCLIYNCLSLPSESLTMSYSSRGADGYDAGPSFAMSRVSGLFGADIAAVDPYELRSWAREPAFELAALAPLGGGLCAAAERALRRDADAAGRLDGIRRAAELGRGSLSQSAVRALYGERLRLSPTRIDAFSSCRFAYFLKYGLRASPRVPAGFNPPEFGVFVHFVLEGVCREIMDAGGFGAVDAGAVDRLSDKYVEKYINDELHGFREKSGRFIYLFRRLTKTVRQVVADTAAELRRSDFVPLDFELRFEGEDGPAPALDDGSDLVSFTGVADRVDGWLRDGKLYLRVVDYKTGTKSFSLSDVWYGMGLQMLLYLFTLRRAGEGLYGHEIVPAGVLYVPARDVLVRAPGDISDEEIARERAKSLRRSGLVLDDPGVINAMENAEAPEFIPVSFNRDGSAAGDSLASAERLGLLSRHIDDTLKRLANEVRGGSIAADPWFRSQQESACLFCDYLDACHFDESRDRRRYQPRLKAPEIWQKLESAGDL